MKYPICRHIRTNGYQCGSPALATGAFCFYHQEFHTRHRGFRHTELTRKYLISGQHIELNSLEDRDSVQIALSVVINALACGQLEPRRATALLYGLQLASMNSAKLGQRIRGEGVREPELTPEGDQVAPKGMTYTPSQS